MIWVRMGLLRHAPSIVFFNLCIGTEGKKTISIKHWYRKRYKLNKSLAADLHSQPLPIFMIDEWELGTESEKVKF